MQLDLPQPSDDGIENSFHFSRAVLHALGLQDLRHVLALEFNVTGANFVPVVKITRALTKGETRQLAMAIEAQRFKLVPDGEPERSEFPRDAHESTPDGERVAVHPLNRRHALTLQLAEQGVSSGSAPDPDIRPTSASRRPGE